MDCEILIYVHREEGHIYLPFFRRENRRDCNALVNLNLPNFSFVYKKFNPNNQQQPQFLTTAIMIYRREKYFGVINWNSGKLSISTTMGLESGVKELIENLSAVDETISAPKITYTYMEFAIRFPREKFGRALLVMNQLAEIFQTRWTKIYTNSAISIEGKVYECLVKKLLFFGYVVDMKIYKHVLTFGKLQKFNDEKITGENFQLQPKAEIQIRDVEGLDLEAAKKEAIPVLFSFIKNLETVFIPMEGEEYELVKSPEKYLKGYQKIYRYMQHPEKQPRLELVKLNQKEKVLKRWNKILSLVAATPKSFADLKVELRVSENTLRSDLNSLAKQNLIIARGRKGMEVRYARNLVKAAD